MLRRRLRSAALALVLTAPLFVSTPASAQGPSSEVARTANCLTVMMGGDGQGGELTGPVSVEASGGGWRMTLPLRGQPFANREVQSPPPASDSLSWYDVTFYANEGELPADRDVMTDRTFRTSSGVASTWNIRQAGGYYWLGANALVGRCFRLMNDAHQIFPQG
jgi:hypothetical protein